MFVRHWAGPVYESFKEEPFKATAPIPYVNDLSMTGVLKIGWDQKMRNWELADYTAIQDTKVAIKNRQQKTFFDRRKLQGATNAYVMLTDDETYETDEFMIVDSLEIVLLRDGEID